MSWTRTFLLAAIIGLVLGLLLPPMRGRVDIDPVDVAIIYSIVGTQ